MIEDLNTKCVVLDIHDDRAKIGCCNGYVLITIVYDVMCFDYWESFYVCSCIIDYYFSPPGLSP